MATSANPIEELKSIRAELSSFTTQYKAGDIVPGPAAARVDLLLARSTELTEIIERGQKSAESMRQVADLGSSAGEVEAWSGGRPTGTTETSTGAKGFISPASIKANAQSTAKHGIKALVAAGSSATAVALDPRPIPLGQPSLGLLSLIPTKVRETPSYSYLRQTVRTNNAAVVAPGGTKPTSAYTVASFPGSLAVVAHMSEYVDKYLLEDNDDLESFLAGELLNGIVRKVTADALTAFSTTPGIQTQAFAGTAADSIYLGASAIGDLGYNPDLIVISRDDYDAARLSKDAEERYLGGNPFEGGTTPGLWGINTLLSSDIAAGTALVLDSSRVGLSIDRAGIQTVWDAISGFEKNEVRARTEGRFGYDVFVPAAIAKVDLTA